MYFDTLFSYLDNIAPPYPTVADEPLTSYGCLHLNGRTICSQYLHNEIHVVTLKCSF